ncbi:MAG: hypothetical protein OXE55_05450 [Flavobacteriaceae bacterium]|nr:hypothetical protein [Flavobacteriaceae bacterium]
MKQEGKNLKVYRDSKEETKKSPPLAVAYSCTVCSNLNHKGLKSKQIFDIVWKIPLVENDPFHKEPYYVEVDLSNKKMGGIAKFNQSNQTFNSTGRWGEMKQTSS